MGVFFYEWRDGGVGHMVSFTTSCDISYNVPKLTVPVSHSPKSMCVVGLADDGPEPRPKHVVPDHCCLLSYVRVVAYNLISQNVSVRWF